LFLDCAWLCRQRLDGSELLPALLENVADKLWGVDESFALARALAGSDEQLLNCVVSFEPPDRCREQFEDRWKKLSQLEPRQLFDQCFAAMERDVLRVVLETALHRDDQLAFEFEGSRDS
jgi:hypothetical protein